MGTVTSQTIWAQAALPGFIAPGLAIAGAAAVAAPVLIHILTRRPRKPEAWAAMRFLLAAYRRHKTRTRLEQLLLLALRCLLVALIGFALAGPIFSAAGALAGFRGGSRTVLLIADHSITSGAQTESGSTRLARLKEAGKSLLGELSEGDRAALISAARPAEPVIAPPTADLGAVRRRLDEFQPSPAAADLPEALRAANRILEQQSRESPAWVVLLSDLSAGAARLDRPLDEQLAALGERARLLRLPAERAAPNVQIASLKPDRRVVLGEEPGQTPSVTWTVRLRRFGAALPGERARTVRLELPEQKPVRRTVRWESGQREATLRIDTPLSAPAGRIAATAALEPGESGTDALPADNEQHALVQVRQELVVALLGRDTPGAEQFTPQRWVATALAPVSDQLGWPIQVRRINAGSIGSADRKLSECDAVFALRPDLVPEAGWTALRRWIDGGGLAWFIPPADPSPTLWPRKLTDTLSLPWAMELEPVEHDPPLQLDPEAAAPAELQRLSADLPALLRPIRIQRRLPIKPGSLGGETDVLLRGVGDQPILIAAGSPNGRGRVLLQAMSLTEPWTNLPTKPLFVPLIHEALRGAIARIQPPARFEPGDRPRLGPRWAGSSHLTGPDRERLLLVPADRTEGSASNDGEGATDGGNGEPSDAVVPVEPLSKTGLYRTETHMLTVNVRADAADTSAPPQRQLEAWLGGIGQWKTLEADRPAAPLRAGSDANLAWPLLWAVLALALAEMLLARRVSHASTARRTADVTEMTRAA